jgi:DNA repair exonuclease SbcCD nuclease subunit
MKDYEHLKKGLLFTDLHFGITRNVDEHNKKCLEFIDFCCENVKKYNIDYIAFLGDYFEHRNALNVATINAAYNGVEKLNALNIPVFMLVSNHDLFSRHSRKIHSLVMFKHFENIIVIEEPIVFNFHKKILMTPWLVSDDEYRSVNNYDADYWYSHSEFADFVKRDSENETYDTPIKHTDFPNFLLKISGHIHNYSKSGNMVYIGNPFSTNYGEIPNNKGFHIHDLEHNTLELVKFDGPRYCKVNLSDILDNKVEIPDNVNCKIIADVSIEYSELIELKKTIQESRNVLSLVVEEQCVKYYADDVEEIENTQNISINDAIVDMLQNIESKEINNKLLVKIYNSL